MRKLLILSVLSLATAGTSGCFHNCCGPSMGGLFAKRPPQQALPCCPQQTVQCCPQQQQAVQCCQPVCCDPCAGSAMTTTTLSPAMPTVPCCQ